MPKLVWSSTGDVIKLNPSNNDVYNYFVEQLNKNNLNRYPMLNLGFVNLSQELQTNFGLVQKLFQNRLNSSAFDFEFDASNQEHLNSLHRRWVQVHRDFPYIEKHVDLQIPGVLDKINKLIHTIEHLTQAVEIDSPNTTKTIPNPFGTDILKYGVFNLSIAPNNLGRTSYNKWINGDTTQDTDTNNFSEFYTTLRLSTTPPIERTAPTEYQQWCQIHSIPCVGSQMPLANFDKLDENLLQYRQLFYKNSLVENNFITLE
jgi:hypothetical protein